MATEIIPPVYGEAYSIDPVTGAKRQEVVLVDASGTPSSGSPGFSGSPTDRSGTITTGGTAQQAAAANASRKFLYIGNPSTNGESIWVRIGGTAEQDSPSWEFVPGSSDKFSGASLPLAGAVSVIAATTGTKFTIAEG